MVKNIPALRVVLTSNCNLNCIYCPPKGENFVNVGKPIQPERLLKILELFYEMGFRNIGFSGGEPLLNKDLPVILKNCFRFKDVYLKLYTNGIFLKKKGSILSKFELIKVSLDSINREKYKELTGDDRLDDVLEGIELAKKNKINIRINTVLTQRNYRGIFDLIDFCRKKQVDLKILDLNCFDFLGYSRWKELYISPSQIVRQLENLGLNKRTIYTTGNYGIPMLEFYCDGITIRIKDTKKNSVYAPVCKNCKYFLCQEGLYQLTFTSDGKLKMCKHRPDIYIDLNQRIGTETKRRISYFLNEHYFSAKRIFSKKQLFLGYFGTNGKRKRESI